MKKTLIKTTMRFLFLAVITGILSCERTAEQTVEPRQPRINQEDQTSIKSSEPKEKEDNSIKNSGQIELTGKITRVVDGDTAEMLYGDLPIMLRMQHIDAPEKRGKQPFGNKAKLVLSELCYGQTVTVLTDGDFDMGGRMIAVIINEDGINVNEEMVRQGFAWHFKKYSSDNGYSQLELEARENRRGLWNDPAPVAPWEFR